jgi:hypothetical protein
MKQFYTIVTQSQRQMHLHHNNNHQFQQQQQLLQGSHKKRVKAEISSSKKLRKNKNVVALRYEFISELYLLID